MRSGDYIVTADWTDEFAHGKYDIKYADIIKRTKLCKFKFYRYDAGERVLLSEDLPVFETMKDKLTELFIDARDESPNATPFEWNDYLEKLVNGRK